MVRLYHRLSWINNHSNIWKVFVANRISQIQSLSDPKAWNYVKTNENPADVLSRGISAIELYSSKLWWHGPDWLSTGYCHKSPQITALAELPELKPKLNVLNILNDNGFSEFLHLNKFSDLKNYREYFLMYCDLFII